MRKPPKRIVFTDFDGVLTDDATSYRHAKTQADYGIAPAPLSNLLLLADEADAKVVISSNWRRHLNGIFIDGRSFACPLQQLVSALGDRFFGYLPAGEWKCNKVVALRRWLASHPEFDGNFVCFDDQDEGFASSGFEANFVKTNPATGLTAADCRRAYKILLGQ